MSKTYDFLQQCGVFFVTTVNGNAPAARPFGAVMEYCGELYISTANAKEVYHQLIANPAVQIIAWKTGTRDWIRIDGKAAEVYDFNAKQAMLDACPVLSRHFAPKECERFALFRIADMKAALHTNEGAVPLS